MSDFENLKPYHHVDKPRKIKISPAEFEILKNYANKHNISFDDALRLAISLERARQDQELGISTIFMKTRLRVPPPKNIREN